MTDTDPLDTLKRLFTSENPENPENAEPESAYECRNCEAGFERHHTACPECGGRSIEQANWDTP